MQVGEMLALSPFQRTVPGALEHEMLDAGLDFADAMCRRMVQVSHDAVLSRAREQAMRDAKFRAAKSKAESSARQG